MISLEEKRKKSSERQKSWRLKNPEKAQKTRRTWREKNLEHIREYQRGYRAKYAEQIREQGRERQSLWRINHPQQARKTRIKWYKEHLGYIKGSRRNQTLRKYKMTEGEYNKILEFQGGGCAICGSTKGGGAHLAIDHNHMTGKVRGILCFKCNSALAMANDNPELLRSMANYLERGGCNFNKGERDD